MSGISRDFDNKTLYNDLKNAVEEEKKYWLRNDAKIRACCTSKNYDEFREIVEAAHLTPLNRKEINKKGPRKWNTYAGQEKNE